MYQFKQIFINGQWQDASEQSCIEVINPANGEVCAITAAATEQDVESAVKAAKGAFLKWSNTSAQYRADLIHAIADEMQNRFSDLTDAISTTMGCPRHLSEELQVQGSIDSLRSFASIASMAEEVQENEGILQYYRAAGVCVLINPWNYPLSQLVGKLGPALAAGCTVVMKPAEQTPVQDLIMAQICAKVGVPAGVVNVLCGHGAAIGPVLCSHPDVDMVSFTGSTQAGVSVAKAAAPTVKRVCQELGGKSPYIITADADLEAAVRYGVEDVMLNSGQTCCALTRMLVPNSVYRDAVSIAKRVAEENLVGDPQSPNSSMGPLSSFTQQQRVRDYIQLGLDEGATLVTGGLDVPEHLQGGAYVMPTIFADVRNEMRIAQEEIFGPVLCVIGYDDEQQAIEIANDTEYGLSSGVYAKDHASALKLASQIRAGQCYIQGAYFNTDAAFGGFKRSGNGREWGKEGLREYLEVQSVIAQ